MKLISIITFLLFQLTIYSQYSEDDIIGRYWTENNEGKVEIYKSQGSYFGKILWRQDDRLDDKNPKLELRNRSVIGITFMENFRFDDGVWKGGSVYSIDNGNTYSGKMWLEQEGAILKMRGYLGLSIFGRTATLTRVVDD